MSKDKRSHVDDLRGASRLAIEATEGITSLVEEMHRTIGGGPAVLGKPLETPARAATGVVYGGIRAVANLVGLGIEGALGQLGPLLGGSAPGPEREALLAALNGVLGDYLGETGNPLAIQMRFRPHHTEAPATDAEGEPAVDAANTLLVMVHGSCMNDQQWCRQGHDHGTALARDLGYRPAYLHYNTGLHVSINGALFAQRLADLVSNSPVPVQQIVIVAHSMGGLVARSACHVAETQSLAWRNMLRSIVFLGTPHHGSHLERAGNWVDTLLGISRYSAPLVRLGKIRSAGVTDLRYGNVLDEHWQGRDRFAMAGDQRIPLPLPEGVACYAIAGLAVAGATGQRMGDGLVPVSSALGQHRTPELTLGFPDANTWTGAGVNHSDLLSSPEVYQTMLSWLSSPPA